MSKYNINVISNIEVNDADLEAYIVDREIEWEDRPEQIKELREKGRCILKDDAGETSILITKVK